MVGKAAIEPALLRTDKSIQFWSPPSAHMQLPKFCLPLLWISAQTNLVNIIKEAPPNRRPHPRAWDAIITCVSSSALISDATGSSRLSPGATDRPVLFPSVILCIEQYSTHCTRKLEAPLALAFQVWPEGQPLKPVGLR